MSLTCFAVYWIAFYCILLCCVLVLWVKQECEFEDNSASGNGGAMMAISCSSSVTHSKFIGNFASNGGAVYAANSPFVAFSRHHFRFSFHSLDSVYFFGHWIMIVGAVL